MTIKLITFKTNQTIMGELENNDNSSIEIKKPVQVIVQQSKEGPIMGFVPFLEYSEEYKTGISFSSSDILTINTPITELINEYNQMFGSGIQIVNVLPKD